MIRSLLKASVLVLAAVVLAAVVLTAFAVNTDLLAPEDLPRRC